MSHGRKNAGTGAVYVTVGAVEMSGVAYIAGVGVVCVTCAKLDNGNVCHRHCRCYLVARIFRLPGIFDGVDVLCND